MIPVSRAHERAEKLREALEAGDHDRFTAALQAVLDALGEAPEAPVRTYLTAMHPPLIWLPVIPVTTAQQWRTCPNCGGGLDQDGWCGACDAFYPLPEAVMETALE